MHRRGPRGRTIAVIVLLVLVAWWLVSTVDHLADQVTDQEQRGDANAAAVDEASKQVEALRGQVKDLGGVPVVEPSDVPDVIEIPGKPGRSGIDGVDGKTGPGPSAAQVAAAVRAYCADINGCAGRDGADVTQAQVAAAVSAYCNDRGECAGPQGDSVKGDQGEPGESVKGDQGDVGPQGPPPSDGQVQAAVDAYCTAHSDCRGAAGTDGKDGAAGEPGRGITALSCDSLTPTRFTVTYSDGTTQTFTCNAGQPEESP